MGPVIGKLVRLTVEAAPPESVTRVFAPTFIPETVPTQSSSLTFLNADETSVPLSAARTCAPAFLTLTLTKASPPETNSGLEDRTSISGAGITSGPHALSITVAEATNAVHIDNLVNLFFPIITSPFFCKSLSEQNNVMHSSEKCASP